MKKTLAVFAVIVFTFSSSPVFAQVPVGMGGVAQPGPLGLEKVGVVAVTQGKVKLCMPGEAGHIAESGEPVFIGQEVSTGANGHLQILLLDETVFTIGPNSSIKIDKFVYDPKSHDGEIRASLIKGVFRYVSGMIAAKKSTNVSMELPTASIGFRGTIVGGSIQESGQGLVALLGPGSNNDANAQIGNFTITGQNGDRQNVNRTGFGVEVGAGGGLSGVFQLSNEQVNNLTHGLMPSGNHGQGGGNDGQGGPLGSGNMSNLSGETGAITALNSALTGALTNLTEGLNNDSTQASQDAAANPQIPNGATTYAQLQRLASSWMDINHTGTGHYAFSGSYSAGGTVTGNIVIDFANQLFGVADPTHTDIRIATDASHIVTTYDGQYSPQSFSQISSSGTFNFNGAWAFDAAEAEPRMIQVGTFDVISIALSNQNGNTAGQATATIVYTAGTDPLHPSPVPSGSGTATATLQPGSS